MSSVLKFVEQLVQETSPADDFPRLEMQDGGAAIPEVKRLEILKRFPEADFNKGKFGFSKGDPRYDQARNIVRREQRSAKAKTPESKARRRELQNLAYKDPEKRKKIRERQRKYFGKPEVQERRSKQQKKMYYEGGKREKDLKRLRGIEVERGYGAALKNPDNNLIKDMIRAERQGKADLKLIRGGNNNVVVAVQEGKKVYAVVGSNRKPLPVAPKNAIPITKHPQFKKRAELTNKLKAFKNTKVPNQNITYGEALDRIEAKRMGAQPMNRSAAEYEHTKGVKEDYKKGQIATRSANVEKKKVLTALDTGNITKAEADRQLKKLGVRGFVKGKYIGAPKIDPDKQIDDLKKYVNKNVIRGFIDIAPLPGPLKFLKRFEKGGKVKKVLKSLRKAQGIATLTPIAGPTIFDIVTGKSDLSDPLTRVSLGAEAAFAPELVKASIGATKGIENRARQKAYQKLLNLGLSTSRALKIARAASPIGIVSLIGEGAFQAITREKARRDKLTQKEKEREDAEQEEQMGIAAAKGGLIPPESGKTPHGDKGLASLADYDMTNTEFINGRY